MAEKWNNTDPARKPDPEEVRAYVDSPLWDRLCADLEERCKVKPLIEYSRCSGAPGWNVKYRKSGRGLCTLYPEEGHFTALVVVGDRERQAVELELPCFTEYLQCLYRDAGTLMGQKWLMIEVTNEEILRDAERLIEIRLESKKCPAK